MACRWGCQRWIGGAARSGSSLPVRSSFGQHGEWLRAHQPRFPLVLAYAARDSPLTLRGLHPGIFVWISPRQFRNSFAHLFIVATRLAPPSLEALPRRIVTGHLGRGPVSSSRISAPSSTGRGESSLMARAGGLKAR